MTENNSDELLKHLSDRMDDLHDKTNELLDDVNLALKHLEEGGKVLQQAAPLIDLAKTWTQTSSKFKGFFKR